MSELRSCAKRFGDLAFICPALPTRVVVYVHNLDFHLINMSCLVIVVKNVLCLAQVVFFYFALHSNKIPLVLTTKVTHWSSLLFREQDGFNCVARTVNLAIIAKLSQNRAVSGLWMLTVAPT